MKAGPVFDSVAVPGETTLPTHALHRYPRSAAHRVPVARAQVAEDEDVRLVCTALAKKVGAISFIAGEYLIPCHTSSPDLVFVLNGQNYTLTKEDYVIPDGGLCLFAMISCSLRYVTECA